MQGFEYQPVALIIINIMNRIWDILKAEMWIIKQTRKPKIKIFCIVMIKLCIRLKGIMMKHLVIN